jgi:type I restriction enzyme S subunit
MPYPWIFIPLKAILDKFEQQVGSIRDNMIPNERESMVFASIRDTLLPEMLSGEIRVKDAEKVVEALA